MRLDLESNPAAPAVFQNDSYDEPDNFHGAERLLKRGVTAAQNGDRDEARKYLTQVIAIDPDCADAWMWLASISDYPEELLAFLNRVLAIDPDNARASEWHAATMSLMAKTFVKRAVAAHNDGNADLAAQCLEQALSHDDNCEDAWAWKASVAEDENQQVECLTRVIEINPDNVEANDAIRQIEERRAEELRLEEERRAEEARLADEAARLEEERRQEQLRQAEEKRIAALFDEAKAAALAGNNGDAVALVDEYLEHHPDSAEACVLRSHLSQSVEEKLAFLDKALEADPGHAAARSAYDFLSSMALPKVEECVEPEFQAEEAEFDAASSEDVAAARAVTEESIPDVEEYLEESEAVDHDALALALEQTVTPDVAEEAYDPYATVEYAAEAPEAAEAHDAAEFELSIEATVAPNSPFNDVVDAANCPFCSGSNPSQAFACSHCNAVLTLSDIEALLSNSRARIDLVSNAVIRMEGDWNERDFSVEELTALGIGHLNLGSFEAGLKYVQEAARLDPNNVVLTGQANALAIRLDEIARQREADDARPRGKTILVVDDSATVRKLISGKLEKSGHNVFCAADGVEALERIGEQVPDLVLLDITMPRMDGYEVCKQIRANPGSSHLPVVMISGKDGFFDKVRGRMAGSTGYVTKPFGPETLMRALETYLLPESSAPVFEPEMEPELEPVV